LVRQLHSRGLFRSLTVHGEAFVFAFYSNRMGCLGSILVSVIGTIVLLVLMRAMM
jgi:hypothetical protein